MLQKFETYQLALQLYRNCQSVKAAAYIKDQLNRAALSVVLNTAEGSAKDTLPRFVKTLRKPYTSGTGSISCNFLRRQ
ncbi:MAG: four helix bundle protein [Bdellovibrionota bacterium]